MVDFKQIAQRLSEGKEAEVRELVQKAVDEGQDAQTVLNEGLLAGMNIVADKFRKNEFYVPEVLIAARAMKQGTEILRPLLARTNSKGIGTIVLGTVRGDLHDIGKNLVGMMLEGAGFEVVDLGIDVRPEKFIESARDKNAQIIGLSALLTTTMPAMREVIDAVSRSTLKRDVRVIIGGAPVTRSFADGIGADGYAPDAASAIEMVRKLLQGRR